MLLHVGEEVLRHVSAGEHHGFAAQGAAFRAANVEGVGQARDVGQRDIGSGRGQSVAEASAIQVKRHVEAVADGRQRLQLGKRVQRAQLRRMGDERCPGKHHVIVGVVGVEGFQVGFQLGGV